MIQTQLGRELRPGGMARFLCNIWASCCWHLSRRRPVQWRIQKIVLRGGVKEAWGLCPQRVGRGQSPCWEVWHPNLQAPIRMFLWNAIDTSLDLWSRNVLKISKMAIRHNRRTTRMELKSFMSLDLFSLTLKIFFWPSYEAIAPMDPPLAPRHCISCERCFFTSTVANWWPERPSGSVYNTLPWAQERPQDFG